LGGRNAVARIQADQLACFVYAKRWQMDEHHPLRSADADGKPSAAHEHDGEFACQSLGQLQGTNQVAHAQRVLAIKQQGRLRAHHWLSTAPEASRSHWLCRSW